MLMLMLLSRVVFLIILIWFVLECFWSLVIGVCLGLVESKSYDFQRERKGIVIGLSLPRPVSPPHTAGCAPLQPLIKETFRESVQKYETRKEKQGTDPITALIIITGLAQCLCLAVHHPPCVLPLSSSLPGSWLGPPSAAHILSHNVTERSSSDFVSRDGHNTTNILFTNKHSEVLVSYSVRLSLNGMKTLGNSSKS